MIRQMVAKTNENDMDGAVAIGQMVATTMKNNEVLGDGAKRQMVAMSEPGIGQSQISVPMKRQMVAID